MNLVAGLTVYKLVSATSSGSPASQVLLGLISWKPQKTGVGKEAPRIPGKYVKFNIILGSFAHTVIV